MHDGKKKGRAREFPFANFFIVTGVSFLLFTGAMRLLDGITIRILLKIGLGSLAVGVALLFVRVAWQYARRNHPKADD